MAAFTRYIVVICVVLGLVLAGSFLELSSSHAQENIAGLRSRIAALLLEANFAEAEPRAKQWLALAERGGPESTEVGDALEALVKVYAGLKRFDDAEATWRRCLDLRVKLVGKKHALITQTLDVMAGIYVDQGRRTDAQKLWREGLAAFDKGPTVAAVERGRNPENPSYRRPIELIEKGQYKDAEEALRRSRDQEALATFLLGRNRADEAVAVHRRLLDAAPTAERATRIAILYRQNDLASQEQEFLRRAVELQQKALGAEHADLIRTLTALAASYERQDDFARAYATLKRASAIAAAVRARQAFTTPFTIALQLRGPHIDLLRVASKLARDQPPIQAAAIGQETFEAGQLVTETVLNATVSQMGLRLSSGSGRLPELVRSRQDLEREWVRLDKSLLEAVTSAASQAERDSLRGQIAGVERKLSALDAQLRSAFPQYFDFTLPKPLKAAEAQSLLRAKEAIAQFTVLADQAYVWIVTKSEVRWAPIQASPAEIERAVAALRCGLDFEASWGTSALVESKARCRDLLQRTYTDADIRVPRPMPFDLGRAHQLYVALFGQVEALIADKELMVIPSGALSSLPLQVLVTKRPKAAFPGDWAGYASASWFVKAQALTVLPSVASLKALREQAGRSSATNPYIAFANPVLTGASRTDRRAAQRQKCDQSVYVADRSARSPAVRAVPARFFRGELGIVEKIRELQPLVETADEVCAVARALGAHERHVLLGSNATERIVKSLSTSGALETYRVVHFATHGLLASETELAAGGPAEPALVLTPPDRGTQEDDGLLTSGEILQLKLNADWVILSACNTAGAERAGADALSGLARAVFYAGARALLVSHWAVDSSATVTLIKETFRSLQASPGAGRGEALRQAMLGMISVADAGGHPAYWAPFVVVGEGGPLR